MKNVVKLLIYTGLMLGAITSSYSEEKKRFFIKDLGLETLKPTIEDKINDNSEVLSGFEVAHVYGDGSTMPLEDFLREYKQDAEDANSDFAYRILAYKESTPSDLATDPEVIEPVNIKKTEVPISEGTTTGYNLGSVNSEVNTDGFTFKKIDSYTTQTTKSCTLGTSISTAVDIQVPLIVKDKTKISISSEFNASESESHTETTEKEYSKGTQSYTMPPCYKAWIRTSYFRYEADDEDYRVKTKLKGAKLILEVGYKSKSDENVFVPIAYSKPVSLVKIMEKLGVSTDDPDIINIDVKNDSIDVISTVNMKGNLPVYTKLVVEEGNAPITDPEMLKKCSVKPNKEAKPTSTRKVVTIKPQVTNKKVAFDTNLNGYTDSSFTQCGNIFK